MCDVLARSDDRGGALHRLASEEEEQEQQDQQPADPEIGAVDACEGIVAYLVGQRDPVDHLDTRQEQTRPQCRADDRPEAVEGLRQCEAEVALGRIAQRSRQRIGGDLQDRDPARQYEQSKEYEIVIRDVRRAEHDQARDHHHRQCNEDRGHCTPFRDDRCRREADQTVGDEEGRGG